MAPAALAILVPALGLTGFIAAGRIQELEQAMPSFTRAPGQADFLASLEARFIAGYALVLAAVLALRLLEVVRDHLAHKIVVRYADGPRVSAPQGLTLLEISRLNGIAHASVCGGRARCSTCRVRVFGRPRRPAAASRLGGARSRTRGGPCQR